MGMGHLKFIMDELVAGGMKADTPAAVVQWASLGRQRSLAGTVGKLAALVEKEKLSSPAIIFVGEVVRAHDQIDWFEHLPLFGRRVAITRSRDQSSELREKVEALGAEVLELPLIRVTGGAEKQTLADVFLEFGSYDWIVFTSANGVKYFFHEYNRLFDDIRSLGLLRFACIGEATAREISAHRIKIECQPDKATAEALADALIATESLDSAKVLVVAGNLNRDVLVTKLEEARAIVDIFPVYKTEKTDLTQEPAAEDFRQKGADAILFCSSSAVQNFTDQAGSLQLEAEAKRPLAGSIGPQTSETMKKVGLPIAFEAKTPSLDSLVDALVQKLKRD
jgi:uroporphyrinogen III methyltransferase/synthase